MNFAQAGPQATWSNNPRTLTSFGTGPLVISALALTTLASGIQVDLRPGAGIARSVSLAFITGAAAGGAGVTGLYDGTNIVGGTSQSVANNLAVQFAYTAGTSSVGAVIKNTGTQSNSYMYAITDLVQ